MATTSQENDFDRAKRWGKEFLAAGQAAPAPARAGAGLTPRKGSGAMRAR